MIESISASKLASIPPNCSFAEASILAESGLTALQAVHDRAEVRPGDRVLVLGASGGVGSFAVQMSAGLGARVTALRTRSNGDCPGAYKSSTSRALC